MVAGLSHAVGGPVGPRAEPGAARVRPLAVLLALTAVVLALGMLQKASCADQEWRGDLTTSSGDADLTRYTHVCDSEVAGSYVATGLDELVWPWSGDPQDRERFALLDQPAGTGLWAWAVARAADVVGGTSSVELERRYGEPVDALDADPAVRHDRLVAVTLNAVGLAVVALLATWALVTAHRRRPWDAAVFAASPLLALLGVASWDLLGAAATAGALAAWSRGRPALAGGLVGLGAGLAVWPALLLPAAGLEAWRRRRGSDVVPAAVVALACWALVQLPAFLTGRRQWQAWFAGAADREPGRGTVWTILAEGTGIDLGTVTTASWLLLAVWVAGVGALALLAPRGPRLAQVAVLLVAGVLLLRASYDAPQALWLLPLAALARPVWRDQLVWQGCEVVYAVAQSWWLGGLLAPGGSGVAGFYWLAIGVHVAGTLWLVGVVVRDVWWPEHDPVRRAPPTEPDRPDPPTGQSRSTWSNEVAV